MLSIEQLTAALRSSWGPDTCYPDSRDDWSPDTPSRDQCGMTALVVQDILGGELILGEVEVDGAKVGNHYWNQLPNGTQVDLTGDQFLTQESVANGQVIARPADAPRRHREQYALLRARVLARLSPDAPEARGRLPEVVVGALVHERRVLLAHRRPDKRAYPNVWDLPGGVVEAGESELEALTRELHEELAVQIATESASHLCRVTAGPAEEPALLSAWLVRDWQGTPANVAPEEHDDIGWFDIDELPPPAHELVRTTLMAAMQSRRADDGPSAGRVGAPHDLREETR